MFLINQINESAGDGKSMVVIGVISIIFIGITLFLLSMDKRLKKIENKSTNEK